MVGSPPTTILPLIQCNTNDQKRSEAQHLFVKRLKLFSDRPTLIKHSYYLTSGLILLNKGEDALIGTAGHFAIERQEVAVTRWAPGEILIRKLEVVFQSVQLVDATTCFGSVVSWNKNQWAKKQFPFISAGKKLEIAYSIYKQTCRNIER